jgi:nicotinamidase-related amidase
MPRETHPDLIDVGSSFLLVIDYQEGYRRALHQWDATIQRASILIRGATRLGIPVLYTEQYPQGVGPTCAEIQGVLPEDAKRFEKRTMSALGAPGLADWIEHLELRHAILAGIETHACINQTAHELIAAGYRVHLPVDTLSSRQVLEHEQGLEKMLRAGALASSVEQVLLECLRSADHPEFKAVQQLIK